MPKGPTWIERAAMAFIPASVSPRELHAPYDAMRHVSERAQTRTNRSLEIIQRDRARRTDV